MRMVKMHFLQGLIFTTTNFFTKKGKSASKNDYILEKYAISFLLKLGEFL